VLSVCPEWVEALIILRARAAAFVVLDFLARTSRITPLIPSSSSRGCWPFPDLTGRRLAFQRRLTRLPRGLVGIADRGR